MSATKDLQGIIKDIEGFAGSIPKEKILRGLIETTTFNILVVGEPKSNYDYKVLWETMKAYCISYGSDVRLHFVGDFEEDEFLKKIIHIYDLDHIVDFVQDKDADTQLSYYLGCDVAVLVGEYDESVSSLLQAYYLYLPTIALNSSSEILERDDILHLSGEPVEMAATLAVLKQKRDYRRVLGKGGRHIYSELVKS